MNKILMDFANNYALNMDRKIFSKDAQRNSQNPILFVFIGDGVSEAASFINNIKDRWNNGDGIVFINISTKNIEDNINIVNFQIPYELQDKKTLRKNIKDRFYNDSNLLENLNKKLTTVRDKILSSGEMFNSFETLSISVVTAADDPLNIILPELSMLIKKRMMEVFKSSLMDLYVLIKEQNIEDEFYSKAFAVSFFREIEYIQSKNFIFNEKIDIYGEERKLAVEERGPVFYITYLLEEKNEKGLITKRSMENNYEIISYISLLKNIRIDEETYSDVENQYYDNTRFKVNINSNSLENGKNIYATGGLAKVKRPNEAIAASVTRAFYENMLNKMILFSKKDKNFIENILKIHEDDLSLIAEELMPKAVEVNDMMSIMTSKLKNDIYKLSIREAEEILYGSRCEEFFTQNFVKNAKSNLEYMNLKDRIKNSIYKDVIKNEALGVYSAWAWTLEEGQGIRCIRECRNLLKKNIQNVNKNIENMYENRAVEGFNIKSIFFKDEKVKEVKKNIFDVYEKKVELLKLQIIDEVLEEYENSLLKINEETSIYIKGLNEINKLLKDYEDEVVKKQDEYTGQNIKAYYENVVKNIVLQMEKIQGEGFYFKDKYIGNVYDILKQGQEFLFQKLIQFCSKYILCNEEFYKPFEEEFNKRANVDIMDCNSKVLSKEELYKKLFNILDENSAYKAYIMNYDVRAYEEKYFFGDYESNFIKYAFHFDREIRNHKIGYIHEKRASGIEKLSLMGGFAAKDVVYIKNAFECYKYCLEKEYELHGIDEDKLPDLNI
ncbi:hypothetical protein [Clostridium lundense]|uniref:hypothetical protein n=1 Tax=Clostridium lundense TaxID=319475 RepID=UPI0004893545|nr:hypothetical protein [Clostridium lundense]